QVAYSWVPPGMPGYDKQLGLQWKFDPAKARALLAQAGYPTGTGFPPVTYVYPTQDGKPVKPNDTWAEFLCSQLQDNLQVSIGLVPMDIADWRVKFRAHNLQLNLTGFGASYLDAQSMLLQLFTCQKYEGDRCTSPSGSNHSRYADPRFDSFLQQAAKE